MQSSQVLRRTTQEELKQKKKCCSWYCDDNGVGSWLECGGVNKGNDGISAHPACVISTHNEVTVLAPWRTPTVSNYPFLFFSLTHDCNGMVKRLFWTVAKGSLLHLRVLTKFACCYHGGHHMSLTKLQLYGLTIVFGEDTEAINSILLDFRIFDDFLSTGKWVAISRSVRIIFLFNQSYLNCILKTFRDIALLAAINCLILSWAINQLLFWQLNWDVVMPAK